MDDSVTSGCGRLFHRGRFRRGLRLLSCGCRLRLLNDGRRLENVSGKRWLGAAIGDAPDIAALDQQHGYGGSNQNQRRTANGVHKSHRSIYSHLRPHGFVAPCRTGFTASSQNCPAVPR